jgi:hypothetical protein
MSTRLKARMGTVGIRGRQDDVGYDDAVLFDLGAFPG